METLVKIVRI